MATTATQLLDAIAKAAQSDYFQANENRSISRGAWDAAWEGRNTLFSVGQLEAIKKSSRQPTKIDVFQKRANGTDTARACSGTGTQSTARYTLTYQTIVEKFSLSRLEFADNDFSYQEALAANLADRWRALHERLEAAAVAYLEANYTVGDGTIYDVYFNAHQVPLSNYDLSNNRAAMWLNKARAEMKQNKYSGPYVLVGDPVMESVCMAMLNQGAGNAINSGFQFNGFEMKFSNEITNNTGIYATAYIFEKGLFGVVPWINMLSREGDDIGTDIWTTIGSPLYSGLTFELKVKKSCTDNSGTITGGQADLVESFVMAIEVAFIHAYSSDSNSGIYKYELDEDENVHSGSGSTY